MLYFFVFKMIQFFKMFQRISILIWLFLLVFVVSDYNAVAQNNSKNQQQFDRAFQLYKMQDYESAIAEIEKLLKKNPDYSDAILLLSDIYRETGLTEKEIETLEKALENTQNDLIFYRLGRSYYSVGNYEKAVVNLNKYLQTSGITEARKKEIDKIITNCRFAIKAVQNPVDFHPERLPESINTVNDEYWPSVSLDGSKLVFTRLTKPVFGIAQEDFFISEFDSAGWETAKPMVEINTSDNEGAQALSADGRLLFFTACNRVDGYGSCDIYYSVYNGKSWSKPGNCGNVINSSNWDGQPSISSDNRFLYFSSGRPGGKGKKDIWRAELFEMSSNGVLKWAKPENLGEKINTEGDEISPFIHPNNKTFYFASDFHTGMGQLDLFQAGIGTDGSFTEPVNLGFPINTFANEQGLNIFSDGKTAYFASQRVPGFGMDIFTFQLPEELHTEPVTYIKAKITDAETGAVIRAEVDLFNLNDKEKHRLERADENGEVLICLPLGATYAFNVSEPGYLFYSQSFQLSDEKKWESPFLVEIKLDPIKTGAEMNLYNIYFETDSFRILPSSTPELDKLFTLLKNNPSLEVEIQGHTDNSGTSGHNLVLSENRARSVADYLILKGIQAQRLKFKGFGETLPVASNDTEDGKMLNRRTTVKITKK